MRLFLKTQIPLAPWFMYAYI